MSGQPVVAQGEGDGNVLPVAVGEAPDLSPLLDPGRLDHLGRFALRTSPPRSPLERLCRLAAGVLGADAASVTIVEDVQTTVARHQLELPTDAVTVTLDQSFCARAMVTGQALAVPDARIHPWVSHTDAARTGRVVGYLGIPLVLSDGEAIGALCVFSDEPREWTNRDERLLSDLAASTATELELRVFATELATSLVDTQKAHARMEYAATHDALTGLANRVLLTRELETALATAEDLALLYCDLDGFKAVNDRFGHATGDALLVEVADRLRDRAGGGALVARLGGDEFAVLARNSSPTLAVRLAEGLHAALSDPFWLDDRQVEIDASFGVVTTALLSGATSGDGLLAAADAAMFEAKAGHRSRHKADHTSGHRADDASGHRADGASGHRARVRLFDTELSARHERRALARQGVRAAVAAGTAAGLDLAFQPDVDLATASVRGLSVHLRLTDPRHRHLSSVEIVEAASELGCQAELDTLVAERLALLRARWAEEVALCRAVLWSSVTAGQLVDSSFVQRLVHLAAQPGPSLGVAVTAEVLGDANAVSGLQTLRVAGVGVAIERFGVERASFTALHRVPLDLLRVDPELIARVDADPYLASAVHALCQLAAALGVEVVADGVETDEGYAALAAEGCSRASGLLLARPLSDGPALRQILRHGMEQR